MRFYLASQCPVERDTLGAAMNTTTNDSQPTTIPADAGYVFNFQGRAFDPASRIQSTPTQSEIDAHNALVARRELAGLIMLGHGCLYLVPDGAGNWFATQWAGGLRVPVSNIRKSWHNMAGAEGRTDCDFSFDGSRWHGINIGDSQILRVKRCKGGAR